VLRDRQLDFDPNRLVCIDETWASIDMARRYGRRLADSVRARGEDIGTPPPSITGLCNTGETRRLGD